MPRRDGEVFLFGTAIEKSPENPVISGARRPTTVNGI
jgi:hypothetical protein